MNSTAHTDNERPKRAIALVKDRGYGGDNEDNMPDYSNSNGNADGLVSSPVGVCDVCAEKGDDIAPRLRSTRPSRYACCANLPELVESRDPGIAVSIAVMTAARN